RRGPDRGRPGARDGRRHAPRRHRPGPIAAEAGRRSLPERRDVPGGPAAPREGEPRPGREPEGNHRPAGAALHAAAAVGADPLLDRARADANAALAAGLRRMIGVWTQASAAAAATPRWWKGPTAPSGS